MMLDLDKKLKKIIKLPTHSMRKIAPQRYFVAGGYKLPVHYTNLNKFKLKKFGGRSDLDGDGIKNKWDCQPLNAMRQDIVTLFHGTKKQNLPIIKKHGLRPTKNVFGQPAVFLTAQKNRAIYHARKGCMGGKCDGAVLKVKVDDKHLGGESLIDFKKHPFKEVRIYNTIPPDKITLMKGASIQKQQEWNIMSLAGKKSQQTLRREIEGDGVPNKYDCQPLNRLKQDAGDDDFFNKMKYVYEHPEETQKMLHEESEAARIQRIKNLIEVTKQKRPLDVILKDKEIKRKTAILNLGIIEFKIRNKKAERQFGKSYIELNTEQKK